MRVCYQCHQPYQGGGYKFCSEACSQAARAAYMKTYNDYYWTWMRPRPKVEKVSRVYEDRYCKRPECGAAFTPHDVKQVYCCRKCSQQMHVPTADTNRASKLQRVLKKHGLAS